MLNIILLLVFIYSVFNIISLAWILFFANVFIFIWHKYIAKFRFSFKDSAMYMFFGLPGSGKSTVCAEIVRQGNTKKKLKNIGFFCNFPVSGAYKIERKDIGVYDLRTPAQPQAVLLLDEASTVYFKRNAVSKDPMKQLKDCENKFHSMHRHYQCMEVFFAQSWDGVDCRLRELSTKLFYVEHSRLKNFIKIRMISKIFAIDDNHQPIDGYDFVKFSSRYVWAPACWKLFDSYTCPDLDQKKWEVWQPFPSRDTRKFFGLPRNGINTLSLMRRKSRGESGESSPDTQKPNDEV